MPTSYIVLITVLIILLITGWFPHYNGLMILVFWKLSFKPAFSLSSLHFTLLFHFDQESLQFLFTFCHKAGVICIYEVSDISSWFLDSSF